MAKEQELLRLRNARVLDINGVRLGKIGEIFLHDRTQKISCVTVALGWLRAREVYVPYSFIDVSDEGIVVQVPVEVVRAAPRADGRGHLTHEQEEALQEFYERSVSVDGVGTVAR